MAYRPKAYVVLFYHDGPSVTDDQYKEAYSYGPNVRFRNARADTKDGHLEECDAVAGTVPQRYITGPAAKPKAIPYVDWLRQQDGLRIDKPAAAIPPPAQPIVATSPASAW